MTELIVLTSKKVDSSSIWFLYGLAQHSKITFVKVSNTIQPRVDKTPLFLKLDRRLCRIFNQIMLILFILFKKGFYATWAKLKRGAICETVPTELTIDSTGIILTDEIINTDLYLFDVYNLHHGEINKYKGRDCMYWEAYNEASYSATVHQVNAQIDQGPIAYQNSKRYSRILELDRIYKDIECGKDFLNQINTTSKILPVTSPSKSNLFQHASLSIRILARIRYAFGR